MTRLAALSRFVMDRMRVHPLAELCIKAVDEDTIAELNEKWMEKEGPTDVLAFPMDELRPGLVNEEPEEGILGDLVLCPAVAERQGGTAGHGTEAELELLDRPRHPAPARLRPRRAGGARGDVRPPGRAARRLASRQVSDPTGGPAGLVLAAVLVVLAGVFSAADAALSSFSRARAEELADEGRAGSRRLVTLLDDPARYLNTALLLRLLCETSAVVLVTLEILRWYDGNRWAADPDHDRDDAGRVVRRRSGSARAPSAASTPSGSRSDRAASLTVVTRCSARSRSC